MDFVQHTQNTLDKYISYDKSWLIRMGVLDLLHGFRDTEDFIGKQSESLGTDIDALARASAQWRKGQPIEVGESGTLYRFLQYAAWKLGSDAKFVKSGTLQNRKIYNKPDVVTMSLEKLLALDNGTSQWASIAVLMGNDDPKPNPMPYKLGLTYEALEHWKNSRNAGRTWQARKDETIARQADAYIGFLRTGKMNFKPEQAEDYCFARAFGILSAAEGEVLWPSLRTHESDRIVEMEKALSQSDVSSKDHRVVQAVAMKKHDKVTFLYPECVTKSWPKFWDWFTAVDR